MKLYNKNNNYILHRLRSFVKWFPIYYYYYYRVVLRMHSIHIMYDVIMLAEPEPEPELVPVPDTTTNNYTFDSCKPFSIVNYLRWRFCSCFLVWHTQRERGREFYWFEICLMYYSYTFQCKLLWTLLRSHNLLQLKRKRLPSVWIYRWHTACRWISVIMRFVRMFKFLIFCVFALSLDLFINLFLVRFCFICKMYTSNSNTQNRSRLPQME